MSTQPHISRSECDCPKPILLRRNLKATFRGLDPEQSYFPMVASMSDQAFYSLPPEALRPKQPESSSSCSHSQATLPSRKAPPVNNFGVDTPYDSGVDTYSASGDAGDEIEVDSPLPSPPPRKPEKDATQVHNSSDSPSSSNPKPSEQNVNQTADTSSSATGAENGPSVVQVQVSSSKSMP